jgi:hypothetical protein
VRFVLCKLKEHGQSCWLLLLDFIKAFDRVPRELLWPLMEKLGVPPTLVAVLMALHAKVNVKFSVERVERTVGSKIGVRQGDLLGPILFNFHVAGALMAWKEAWKSAPPALRSKCDFVLNGREWRKERVEGGADGEGGELMEVADTLYADDTGQFFHALACGRSARRAAAGRVLGEVRPLRPRQASRPEEVQVGAALPRGAEGFLQRLRRPRRRGPFRHRCWRRKKHPHVESSAKYLGSVLHSNGKDDADVTARVKKATGAFTSLKHCLFKRKDVTNEAKVTVYNSLVLSILLFGCESRSLTQRVRDKLQTFHRGYVRDMCRLNMWHVQQYRITAQHL